MKFGTVKKGEDIRDVKFKTIIKTINQSELTSECWLIQIQGVAACKKCELFKTEECGGKEILKKLNKI